MLLPTKKLMLNEKSNNATLATLEMIILKLVAKPLRILSEYLITTAVINPPNTCVMTVAHAHGPKFSKSERNQSGFSEGVLSACECGEKNMGMRAGRRENSDSCTLRTHKSAFEFLSTFSK